MTTFHRAFHHTRDRHGRGPRGILLPPGLPGALTRSQRFDQLVLRAVAEIVDHLPAVADIEIAVEDVPHSTPAQWESPGVPLGRAFPAQRSRRLPARVVCYRLPIQARCHTPSELRECIAWVVVENVANLLALPPSEVAPPGWNFPTDL